MMWKQMRRSAIKIEGERSSSMEISKGRLSILGMFFVASFALLGLRAADLGIVQGEAVGFEVAGLSSVSGKKELRRGNIYDRNGMLLATTIKSASLFADPALIIGPEKVASGLVKMFPDLQYKEVLKALTAKGRYSEIRRSLTPAQQKQVLTLGQPGLGFSQRDKRIYPLGNGAAHIIGFTDLDGNGLAGVERNFDKILAAGEDVKISLDMRLQHAVKRETQKAIDDFTALAGAAVVMDAKSGEILAGVSLPDFNLNIANEVAGKPQANKEYLFNRLTLGVYELGSMFKIFSTAAFFETHHDGLEQAFDVRKPIKIGRFMINDFKGKNRTLSVPEVFIYSSNIGTANMGRMVGGEYLQGFYKDLGLLDPMAFDIKEVGRPKSPASPWKEVSILTASYGHGLSTTPLQMAAGVASVINGGFKVNPTLVLQDERKDKNLLRVVSGETSEKMRKLLRLVVTQGTGSKAEVSGFSVGGKTGTAEKIVNGRYEHKKLISSFVSAFPMNDPQYIVMVMVDEPKPNKQSHGYATAGWVAAPAVGRIVASMASIMGMPADGYDPAQDISLDFLPYIKESYDGKKVVAQNAPIVQKPVTEKKEPAGLMDQKGVQRVSY